MKQTMLLIGVLMTILSLKANDLDVFWKANRFYEPQTQQAYAELVYFVPGNALTYSPNAQGNYQAKVNLNIQVKQKGKTLYSKAFLLQTKSYAQKPQWVENITDLLRIPIATEDTVILYITMQDISSQNSFADSVQIIFPKAKSFFSSDLVLISEATPKQENNAFVKNELTIVPKFLNYYPTEITEIKFYSEIYQTDSLKKMLYTYLLTDENGLLIANYATHRKIEKQKYTMIVGGFNIEKLSSGNYYLFAELKNDKGKVLERKRTYFQRYNKSEKAEENKLKKDKNELGVISNNFARKYDLRNIKHHLLALMPIATIFERASLEGIAKTDNVEQMQNYFYSFWAERNPQNPELEWKTYAEKLQYVEKNFTTAFERGYETPRGSVYLLYGKPFHAKLYNKKNKGEFWVWNYEQIGQQSNVYFVFLNNSNITDDFKLVHTSLKGYIYSKEWAEYIKNEL